MRFVLVVLILAVACGDNENGPALRPSDNVVVVAHQDDDLLFMQPDLGDRVAAHQPTTVVYVTAGDAASGLPFALARIGGSKASYGIVANETDWNCGWIDIDGHAAYHCRLEDAALSLVFLGYPDGGIYGTTPTSLQNLWEGKLISAETVAEIRATYTRDGLIETVADVIAATHPTTIRTLEIAGTHGYDHSDHMFVGALTMLAVLHANSTAQVVSYRGYNINNEPPNLTDDNAYEHSSLPMRAYEACLTVCDAVCAQGACSVLADTVYQGYAHRRYAVSTRQSTQSGLLSSEATGGCIVSTGATVALGSCDAATTVELEPGNLLAVAGGCLEVEADNSIAVGACEPAPERAFALDDEGHIWSGVAPPSQPGMDTMHTSCLVGDANGLHLGICGTANDARWDLVRTPVVTPRRLTESTSNTGRAIRLGDINGDGLADMCTVSPNGLLCAAGDGTGAFGAMRYIGSGFAIQPQSLALGDVDGDGIADACGRDAGGITCLSSKKQFHAERWTTSFASSGPASSNDRSLAIVRGLVCGSTPDNVICADGSIESILTSWPATAGAPLWPADLDGDELPDWCTATTDGVVCGLAAEQTITDVGTGWGFSFDDIVEGSVASDGSLPDTVHSAIADVSGDGRGDLCVAVGDRVECAVGQDHGFGPRYLALVMPSHQPILGIWLGDLDGDGKADPCADDGIEIACSLSP